jgi:hypothetical protein
LIPKNLSLIIKPKLNTNRDSVSVIQQKFSFRNS